MGMMRRLIAVGVGLAAGAVAATVLKKLNDPILDEDEVMIPPQQPEGADETVEAPAAAEEPAEEPAREPAVPAAEEGKAEEPAPARARCTAELGLMLLDEENGLFVLAITEYSPAWQAGFQAGDLLLSSGDTQLTSVLQL